MMEPDEGQAAVDFDQGSVDETQAGNMAKGVDHMG